MARFRPLTGSHRLLLPKSRLAGPVNLSEVVSLTLRVRSVGDPSDLEKWVRNECAKPVAQRAYWTREQLAKEHGANPADFDRIERYAIKHRLTVVRRGTAERAIVLKGTLGDLLKAFPAKVSQYKHMAGSYRGRSGKIQIPLELDGVITAIYGFDTRLKKRISNRNKLSPLAGSGGTKGELATFYARRYNFPQTYNGVALDGTGQNIAIIELGGGYDTNDLIKYFSDANLPMPSVTFVPVDGEVNAPGSNPVLDSEVMLDIEVAGAVAPKANLIVYFAPNTGEKGLLDAISAAVYDKNRKIDVISISWGNPEPDPLGDPQALQFCKCCHDVFLHAPALGITICAASGDHGAAGQDGFEWDHNIHVIHPAADELVLACGGTQIDPVTGADVVWNDGTPFDPATVDGGGWASGGGISKWNPAVPFYQQNAGIPISADGGTAGRGVPDIAMCATNYLVRADSREFAKWGTSAVAPLMASLVALLNQAKRKNVGFLNAFLYTQAAAGTQVVHDVTQGTNKIADTGVGYNAGPGWDACTGLGVPDGVAILKNPNL